MKTITTQDIVNQLNTTGYNYFGDRPRAYGDRIFFGRDYVRYEGGLLTNNREGKARALTIGYPALVACETAKKEIEDKS